MAVDWDMKLVGSRVAGKDEMMVGEWAFQKASKKAAVMA